MASRSRHLCSTHIGRTVPKQRALWARNFRSNSTWSTSSTSLVGVRNDWSFPRPSPARSSTIRCRTTHPYYFSTQTAVLRDDEPSGNNDNDNNNNNDDDDDDSDHGGKPVAAHRPNDPNFYGSRDAIDRFLFDNSKTNDNEDPVTVTPGQILFVLQRKAGIGSLLSYDDVRRLCTAAREDEERDASAIFHGLLQFRRVWNFAITPDLAGDALRALLRAGGPTAAARAFHFRRTGLYYTASTHDVTAVIRALYDQEMERNDNDNENDNDNDNDNENENENENDNDDTWVAPTTSRELRSREPLKLTALYLLNPPPSSKVHRRKTKKRARAMLRRMLNDLDAGNPRHFLPQNNDNNDKVVAVDLAKEVFYALCVRASSPERVMSTKGRRAYLGALAEPVTTEPLDPSGETVECVLRLCRTRDEASEVLQLWKLVQRKSKATRSDPDTAPALNDVLARLEGIVQGLGGEGDHDHDHDSDNGDSDMEHEETLEEDGEYDNEEEEEEEDEAEGDEERVVAEGKQQ